MTTPVTQPPETRPDPLRRFLLGAAPPAIATFAALWQILAPYMPTDTRGFLYAAFIIAWVCPFAVWVGCKVDKTDAKFAKSDQAAAALAEERHNQALQLAEEHHRRALERMERFSNEMFVFIESIEQNQQKILAKLECIDRSIKGLHRHLNRTDETLDGALEEVTKEVTHLRNIVLEVDEAPAQQRLGPRSLS
jgi:hypothetical protein